jgi:hypothetical protein
MQYVIYQAAGFRFDACHIMFIRFLTFPCLLLSRKPPSPSSIEVKVAERRVETAVCAFGGYLDPLTRAPPQDESSPSVAKSIFRLRGDALKKQKYETDLPKRYTLSGSVVSWEVRR